MKYRAEWGQSKPKAKSLRKRYAALYQLAGSLLLADAWTPGQSERLTDLLLDVLSEPERYTAKLIAELQRLAVAE
jgi:hypothetical protein